MKAVWGNLMLIVFLMSGSHVEAQKERASRSLCENSMNRPGVSKPVLPKKSKVVFKDYVSPKMATGPSVVIYSQTESTVNGRPFLPLGIYAVNVAEMPKVKELGFNLVQSYQFFDMTKAQKKEYLDTARKNGLMVFAGLNGTAQLTKKHIAEIKKTVNAFKNHPALYAWYLADEPAIKKTKPAELKAVYDWIKQMDPNHPVITSNWELGNFKDACDLDMRQLYQGVPYQLTPGLEGYLKNKPDKAWVAILNSYDSGWGAEKGTKSINPTTAFSKLAENGFKDGDPEWEKEEACWLSLLKNPSAPGKAGFQTSVSFPNTPEEIRGAFYWALAHGSNGVYYWLFSDPKGALNLRWGWYTIFFQPRLCAALQSTLGELKELSSYLINPFKDSISFKDSENPGMFVWSKVVDNKRIVIVINETGKEFKGSVNFAPLCLTSLKLRVYKEDERVIQLENNKLKDSFKKDEAHVYFVME